MKYEFVAVDVQNEFASEGGKFYSYKPSVKFLEQVFFPFLKGKDIRINEIVSDYRQPRPGDSGDGCYPGTWGYESLIPLETKKAVWVKAMNSPIWIRENGGEGDKQPGIPFPDSNLFGKWIEENIGKREEVRPVIFGLTIDCCVLCTVQEFKWRGFKPIVIIETVDHASGSLEDRDVILEKSALSWWAEVISFEDFKKLM